MEAPLHRWDGQHWPQALLRGCPPPVEVTLFSLPCGPEQSKYLLAAPFPEKCSLFLCVGVPNSAAVWVYAVVAVWWVQLEAGAVVCWLLAEAQPLLWGLLLLGWP